LPEELGYLYYLHIIYATLVAGNAYVRGSSQALSDTLVDIIQSGGGVVKNREAVQQVSYDDQLRVTGVVTKKGTYNAPLVMLNAAPRYALDQLFDAHPALDGVRRKAAGLRSSLSTTTLYLVLDTPPDELGLSCSETMIFQSAPHQAATQRAAADGVEAAMESAYWRHAPMEITNYHLLNPAGGYVVILNVLDRIEHWPMRKTPEYRAKKARAAQIMLERLLERKPAIAGHVKYQEVSSPHTYQRYTNNTDGAGYGAFVGPNAASHLFHHGFPVKGVHFLSAWVAGPSYEAAFGYAEVKAKALFSAPTNAAPVRLAA
jgi:phytoene dehydrogenase-like protein